MAAVANADEQAFRRLVEKHQSAVVGTVAKMLGGAADSEDIAQQVFIRVWKSAKRYKPTAKFTTWLYTIAKNLVFNESRRRSRKKTGSLDALREAGAPDPVDCDQRQPDDEALQAELEKTVDRAIARLPEKQRLAVILRQHQGLPYEEIGSVLGLSLSAVKSQLFRAREALKADLADFLDR